MSIVGMIGPWTMVGTGLIAVYLFWLYIGSSGHWEPWRENLHLIRDPRRPARWRTERDGWIRSGTGMVLFMCVWFVALIISRL